MRYAISARHPGGMARAPKRGHAIEWRSDSPRLYDPNYEIRRGAAIATRNGFWATDRFARTYRLISGNTVRHLST